MSHLVNPTQPDGQIPSAGLVEDPPEIQASGARRAVVSGTFGTALEWFDFAVYGTLSATVFPLLFFPGFDSNTAVLASFATFGAGMMARPLGGVVFGALGDKIGRRDVLMVTLVLMGASSVLIGLLPTYATIGILAPVLLVLLRFLQGFALGGESTGAQVLVVEHAPHGRRGLFGGFLATGSPLAQSFAALTLTGLAVFLPEESFNSWGWRVPFLMGVGLLVVGVYIRRKLEETPAFKESKRLAAETSVPQERALAVVVKRPLTVARLIGACAAMAALFWICVTYSVNYLTSELGYDNSETFAMILIANMISIPAAVFGGWASDKIGRKKTFLLGLLLMGIAAGTMFPIMDSMNSVATTAIIALALCGIQIDAGTQAAFFAESLPTSMRYTGSALGMTFGGLIFGAPIPFIAAWIFQNTENGSMALTIIGLSIVALSMISTMTLPERFRGKLSDCQ